METSLRFRVGTDLSDAGRSLTAFAGRIGGLLAGAFTVGTAGAMVSSFVRAGAELETYESRLSTLMGSASEARARLGELFDYAAKTPFEVGEVVRAETTLRGFGAAAEDLLPGLIDFAATSGAELQQSAIDIGKAWNQGATGLESDTARILRKQIELRAGMDATKMSLEDFRGALLETLDEGMFAGGADRLSRTFSGMVSNLRDEWGRFQLEVADAGLFQTAKAVLSETLDLINGNRDAIKETASVVSDGLYVAFEATGTVIAAAVDGVTGLRLGLALAVAPAADLGAALLTATQPIRDTVILMADAFGLPKLAQGAMWADARLADVRKTLEGARDEAEAMVRSFDPGGGALNGFRAFLERVEGLRGSFAPETGTDAAGPPGGGTGGKSGGDAARDDYAQQFAEAQAYYRSLEALRMSDYEKAEALRDEQLDRLMVYAWDGLVLEDQAAKGREAIWADYYDTVADLDAQLADSRQRAHAEELARIQEEKRERLAALYVQLDAAASVFSTISSLIEGESERAKRAQKAWAYASIAIDTAVGIQKAFAQYGWPWGLLPAAAIGTQGIAQAVAVSRAHQGGSFAIGEPMPDEQDVVIGGRRRRTLAQERVVVMNSQAARAAEAANATNGAPLGFGGAVELRIGREMQRELVRETERTGVFGSAVRRVVGYGQAAGFSGALAVA